jgi:hypothetical protein
MELPSLNQEHRRIAQEARERIGRLMSGQAFKDLAARIDTKLADSCNSEDEQ